MYTQKETNTKMAREKRNVYDALIGGQDKTTEGTPAAATTSQPGTAAPAGDHKPTENDIAAAIIASPGFVETRGRKRIYDPTKPPKEKGLPDGWERQSYLVKTETADKYRALAWYVPGMTIKDLINKALENYLTEKVDQETIEKALDGYRNREGVKVW